MIHSLSLRFVARAEPLSPSAVACFGDAATRLAQRLVRKTSASHGLSALAGSELLFLQGDADALPWCDGAIYLGRDKEAPGLLLPTALRPSLPAPLLERALRLRFPETDPPLAVIPRSGAPCIVAASAARALDLAALSRWLESRIGAAACPP